jgi:Fe-S cluster assembly protein SufD
MAIAITPMPREGQMNANVTPIRTIAETTLIERFGAEGRFLPGHTKHRHAAFALIEAKGLPNRRDEAWKYTDWRGLLREAAPLPAKPALSVMTTATATGSLLPDAVTISLVNGHFAGVSGTLPAGVSVVALSEALASSDKRLERMGRVEIAADNAALALNTAFMSDGVIIEIAPGAKIEAPVLLRFISHGEAAHAAHLRVLVLVGEGSSLTLIEQQETRGAAHQPNSAIEMLVGDGAEVNHVRATAHDRDALVLSSLIAELGKGSSLTSASLMTSGAAHRQQAFVRFGGADARLTLNGGMMGHGRQHLDSTLVADHAEPGGVSRELFRTVLDGEATGVFQGKIIVRQKAQQTDGRMASNAVMLGEDTTMNNKPELEIFADDVQCAHGATCGALDDDLLFYLMARGLPRIEAEALMVESFIAETLEPVTNETVREALTGQIDAWLKART